MSNDYVTPINHSGFSAATSTTAGAAGGALKGGLKGAVIGFLALTLLGSGVGLFIGLGGLTGIGAAGSVLSGALSAPVLWTLGGTALGAFGGWILGAPVGAALGGTVGGVKGGSRASQRVAMERGAATELQAQVEMARAQAVAPAVTNVYANDNKYGFPAHGTAMNPAAADIQLDGAQLNGTAVGRSREAAMA